MPLGSLVAQLSSRREATRAQLAAGFQRWEDHIARGLSAMLASGRLRRGVDPVELATAVLAATQGGLPLSQARGEAEPLRPALAGARAMLEAERA